jgi:hypothetical protein
LKQHHFLLKPLVGVAKPGYGAGGLGDNGLTFGAERPAFGWLFLFHDK